MTGQFHGNPTEAAKLDAEFAVLTALRTRYAKAAHSPILTLGTIVAEDLPDRQGETQYWLCIQPPCDCVRLTGERAFPFLPYTTVTQEKEAFELTIQERDGNYIRLKLELHPYGSRMVTFTPREVGQPVIEANGDNEHGYVFTGAGTRLRWVAELKNEQAQRVVNAYAAELSRPGVDESEWQRLSGKSR